MTLRTDAASEPRNSSVEPTQPARSASPASGTERDQPPAKSFAEVLRGKDAQHGAGQAGAAGEAGGERFGGGLGDAIDKPRRGLSMEADDAGALAAFRIPASILQAPAAIARPTLASSGVASAAQAIADRVVETVRIEASPGGRLEFVLETKTDVLGGAEIRVRIEDGRVHATFATARPEVRAALESQAHLLRDALVARGLDVGEVAVKEPSRKFDDPRDRREGSGGGGHDEPPHGGRRSPNR